MNLPRVIFDGLALLLAQASPATQPGPATQPSTAAQPSTAQALAARLGLQRTFHDTRWEEWLLLLGCIFGGVLAGWVASQALKRVASRLEHSRGKLFAIFLCSGAAPANLACITIGISFGLNWIAMDPAVEHFAAKVINLLGAIAIGWFIFNLVDLVDLLLHSLASRTHSKLDDQIAPLVRKALRIFVVVLIGLYVAQNIFNQNISAWLAGLGIAGLAVSLAAQESIKNLFGSITILLDKPFAVGDRIVFGDYDGPVEEIGFRSTRVRTLAGELATIPNSKFIDGSVKNVSKRGNLQKSIDLTLRYDSTADQIRQAIEIAKSVVGEPGIREAFNWEANPPRVYFESMKPDSYNVRVQIWFADVKNWWGFVHLTEQLQLRLMEEYAKAGLNFSLPTQMAVLPAKAEDSTLAVRSVGGDDGQKGARS